MLSDGALADIEAALGAVTSQSPLTGGDINRATRVQLADGRAAFVKTHPSPPPTMYEREAEGLAWLGEAGALRVPEVLGFSPRFLALELILPGAPARDHDAELGRGLAALHAFGAPRFGHLRDNFIGDLPQDNGAEEDWPTFYVRRRLEPQLRRAVDAGRASSAMQRGLQSLFARITERVGPAEPPSRLHGDLWGGNAHVATDGAPVLIDPAAYGGHREMDLAMMRLFGGFSQRVFDAYAEAWPLAPGAAERVPLYQLYPLMVHVNLFGGSYVGSVERALREIG
ncbi:MAG: fructosamine kinase family protein [Sandaracinaceae bacterium]|nr:fructosamine kinase family protein [Sandaracinaceae bacterium]